MSRMKVINFKIIQPLLVLVLSNLFFIGCQNIEPAKSTPETSVQTHQISHDKIPPVILAYNEKIGASIESSWTNNLASRHFVTDKSGNVTIKFKLHSDGTISDTTIVDEFDEVAALICLQTISDLAPFPKWTNEMRQIEGANDADFVFHFYYGLDQVHRLNK
jgi:hypothetical protein